MFRKECEDRRGMSSKECMPRGTRRNECGGEYEIELTFTLREIESNNCDKKRAVLG